MARRAHVQPSDVRGYARLARDATLGLTDLVEAMHATIARPVGTGAVAGLVYRSIRGITRLAGGGADALLALLAPALKGRESSPERDAVHAALNGVLGDYLAASGNPLAIRMSLRRDGRPFVPPPRRRKLVVLVHGLCLGDRQWRRNGHDHGVALARDLGCPVAWLRYNSGLHVSENGRALAALLEKTLAHSPVRELSVVAHSMGGLVVRSAWHYGTQAGHVWPGKLARIVFLGTPHHGAPLERGGNWIDRVLGATPYAWPFARLGRVRSAGITDLRHGSLLDEDWRGRDRFAKTRRAPAPLPLPEGVRCFAIGATIGGLKGRLLGDGLVPLDSALGRHEDPARHLRFRRDRQWVARGVSHLGLLDSPAVYARLRKWLADPG